MRQHHVARAEVLHAVAQHLNMCLHAQLIMLLEVTAWFCILALLTLRITRVLP